jgi:hypothetical protein
VGSGYEGQLLEAEYNHDCSWAIPAERARSEEFQYGPV